MLITPKNGQNCHSRAGPEFQASRHADAAEFIGSLDNTQGEIIGEPAANTGCFATATPYLYRVRFLVLILFLRLVKADEALQAFNLALQR